ncbi:hypothetical protein CFOL_v3_05579 [Cephalotus follicularis]|uniref:UBN2_3 domain-containing protein n=1 Tax=Cephalotus follicularis TaxID=3775 RepID=A0A1Q3B2D7_CEPFO|nr:hypothetical protein CFOL_v3_05579 [Cephalotus follicularis]
MATKNIIADLNKGEKLTGTNYDIWHKKMTFLLNEQELFEHLTTIMTRPPEGNTAQSRRDLEAFETWSKKDRCARFTLLSCMHDDNDFSVQGRQRVLDTDHILYSSIEIPREGMRGISGLCD